jgi:hypothetical protein
MNMKNLNKIIKFPLFSMALMVLVSACDFEEINTPFTQVSDEEMNRDNMKSGAMLKNLQNWVVPTQNNAYQMTENLLGDVYGRYMTASDDKFNIQNFAIYTASEKWINWPFKNVMPNVYTNWNQIREITEGKGVIFAWAQLLRVASMQRLTDVYGPIPYSKVETGELKVAYDSQEEVYHNMFNDLDWAIDVLTSSAANSDNSTMKDFDLVYGGDFTKWVKLANSLKLRMAMRIRFVDPILAKEMAEEAISHPIGVITTNSDNASIESPVDGNPLYIMWKTYGDTRVCADIASYMNGYKDPRREKYFQTATINSTTGYLGLRAGANIKNTAWGEAYSAPVAENTDRVMWMTASEIAFLKAEGTLAGWNMGGSTVGDLYNEGIKLSFEQWGVSGADAYSNDAVSKQDKYVDPNNMYSTGAVSTVTIKWEEEADETVKLERIMTQKWLALWPNGQEAWSEYRRTGYPVFFSVAQNVSPNIVVANRIPFCVDEYKNNAENMDAALKVLNGADNYQTRLWWDVYRK